MLPYDYYQNSAIKLPQLLDSNELEPQEWRCGISTSAAKEQQASIQQTSKVN